MTFKIMLLIALAAASGFTLASVPALAGEPQCLQLTPDEQAAEPLADDSTLSIA